MCPELDTQQEAKLESDLGLLPPGQIHYIPVSESSIVL